MPRLLLIGFITIIVVLAALPRSLFAIDTYLPAIGEISATATLTPIPTPTAEPTPIPALQDGLYEYDDGVTDIYFKVIDQGAYVDYGGFSIKSSNPLYCSDAGAGFLERVPINNREFRMINMSSSYMTLYGSLRCQFVSDTQATCKVYDYFANSTGSYVSCGYSSGTVTLK